MSQDKRFKVLSAIGHDRPGLVKEISAILHRAGANIEDSRMAMLGGEFAMLVLCSGSVEALERTETESRLAGKKLGLDIQLRDTALPVASRSLLSYRLRVSGLDHPGIVEAVSSVLARREVNVASLETSVVHQPLTGTPTFVLESLVHVPSSVAVAELRRDLERAAEEENLDLSFEAV